MRYLITGGCGFLGSNLAARVLASGDELCVLDSLSRQGSAANLDWLRHRGELRFVEHDIRDAGVVSAVVRDFEPEVVFHLAGQVAMTTSLSQPRLDFEVNALGTLNVLEALRAHAPGVAMVYSSTNKVYGDLEYLACDEQPTRYVLPDRPDGLDESTPLDFHSPYGCSKGAADQYVLDYARMFGLRAAVFRHSSIYGSRQFSTFDQGWIGWFCQKALEAKASPAAPPFSVSGNGKQVRDVLHAEDAVGCYLAAAGRIDSIRGQAFNIGGGVVNSLSLLELFSLLEDLTGAQLRYEHRPVRDSDQKVFIADLAKVTRHLGWAPGISSREGISRMLGWIEAQSVLAP